MKIRAVGVTLRVLYKESWFTVILYICTIINDNCFVCFQPSVRPSPETRRTPRHKENSRLLPLDTRITALRLLSHHKYFFAMSWTHLVGAGSQRSYCVIIEPRVATQRRWAEPSNCPEPFVFVLDLQLYFQCIEIKYHCHPSSLRHRSNILGGARDKTANAIICLISWLSRNSPLCVFMMTVHATVVQM